MVAERTAAPPAGPAASSRRELSGVAVVFTGRLASMAREEAAELVRRAGGRVEESPGPHTGLLVVGEGGPPLGEDGQLTRSLREAQALCEAGAALAIVGEAEFLRSVAVDERRADLQRLYTTGQLARILDVAPAELRRWTRLGLIRPAKVVRRLHSFDFRQVATARRLAQLTRAGVGAARLRKSLEQLSAWLPHADAERALAQLEALEGGSGLALRTEEGLLAEPTGQLRLSFGEMPASAPSARRGPGAQDAPGATLDAPPVIPADAPWFERAVLLEEAGRFEEAVALYRQGAELDGGDPETLFNLGNALWALERHDEAARAFARATTRDPEFVEAWNNLGNALGRAGRTSEAVAAFARALALEPRYADAHFNLAETLAAAGDVGGARHHWRAYLEEDPWSPWADVVRERLTLRP